MHGLQSKCNQESDAQTTLMEQPGLPPHRPRGTLRSHDPLHALTFGCGQGPWVWDTAGKRYLDLICGYSACNLGHAHPALVAAATSQLQQLTFAHGGQHPGRDQLESQLANIWKQSLLVAPGAHPKESGMDANAGETTSGDPPIQVWLSTTGARAIEVAWKLACTYRPGGVARFDLAYHGRSLATSLITDTRRSQVHFDHSDENVVIPFPIACECDVDLPLAAISSECCEACQLSLDIANERLGRWAVDLSFLVVEPAIGSRGYYFASPEFHRRLVRLSREHGLLVISDEIQMGLGRLGPMIVGNEDGWEPDLVVLGKSLGGGIVPISAVLGRADILDRLGEGIESETFAASPLACRIASCVLEELSSPCLLEESVQMGKNFRERLRERLPRQLSIRGRGMATALGLEAWGPNGAAVAHGWVHALSHSGVLAHLTGSNRDRIALLPPLNVSASLLEDTIDALERTLPSRLAV
ncbi:MAG: aminotransferase class III-fold pyridoxal phosphate-dependent enzyme [Planctomycetota bacterium]